MSLLLQTNRLEVKITVYLAVDKDNGFKIVKAIKAFLTLTLMIRGLRLIKCTGRSFILSSRYITVTKYRNYLARGKICFVFLWSNLPNKNLLPHLLFAFDMYTPLKPPISDSLLYLVGETQSYHGYEYLFFKRSRRLPLFLSPQYIPTT